VSERACLLLRLEHLSNREHVVSAPVPQAAESKDVAASGEKRDRPEDKEQPDVQVVIKKTKLESLMDALPERKEQQQPALDSDAQYFLPLETELLSYKTMKVLPRQDCPLKFWRNCKGQYPLLSKFARKYLCVPATSAPSERLFSKAGELVSKRRAHLSDDTIEQTLFLHYNLKFLSKKLAKNEKKNE
jgi:hypothetical protein